jgi:hypothetical protein
MEGPHRVHPILPPTHLLGQSIVLKQKALPASVANHQQGISCSIRQAIDGKHLCSTVKLSDIDIAGGHPNAERSCDWSKTFCRCNEIASAVVAACSKQ